MNEKGFLFPVTLCILLLFSIFLLVHFNQYVTEKRLLLEVEEFERNQFYFLQSLVKIESELAGGEYDVAGTYRYERGDVSFTVMETDTNLYQITFQLITEHQNALSGIGYYDPSLQKIIKWVERN